MWGLPSKHTHSHMCTHSSPAPCPIFLLAHHLLSPDTDACSVRRVCHRITMQPFSEQTAPPQHHHTHTHTLTPTPSEQAQAFLLTVEAAMTKHFNKTSPPGTVVRSAKCLSGNVSPSPAFATETSAILRRYWLALCRGEIMVIMSPTKSMLLRSLYKDLSPLQ